MHFREVGQEEVNQSSLALAQWLSWLEHHQKVWGLILAL